MRGSCCSPLCYTVFIYLFIYCEVRHVLQDRMQVTLYYIKPGNNALTLEIHSTVASFCVCVRDPPLTSSVAV